LRKTFLQRGYWKHQSLKIASLSKLLLVSIVAFSSCLLLDHFYMPFSRSLLGQCFQFFMQFFCFFSVFAFGLFLSSKELFFTIKSYIISRKALNEIE
jgi:hypothetical protein